VRETETAEFLNVCMKLTVECAHSKLWLLCIFNRSKYVGNYMHHLLRYTRTACLSVPYDSANETGSTLSDQFLCLLGRAIRIFMCSLDERQCSKC
jgi:hypothetical protein